jgi:hypothetical protein
MGLLGSVGKFFTGGKKKSSKSKSEGTSDYDPWAPTIPYLENYLKDTDAMYANTPQFSEMELAGYDALRDTVGRGGEAIDPAIAENNKTLSGYYLNPDTNPYIKDIASRMAGEAATQSNASFAGSGRTGSGLAGRYAGLGAAQAAGDLYYQNYGDERGRMGSAVGMAPTLEQGRYLGPQALISAGQNISARPYDINQQRGNILGSIAGLGQQGKTTGEQTNYGYQQGLIGKVATSFTNKLFNLGG